MNEEGRWITTKYGNKVFIRDKDVNNYMNKKIRNEATSENKLSNETIKNAYNREEVKKYNGRRMYIVKTTPDDFLKLTTDKETYNEIINEVNSKKYNTSAAEALNKKDGSWAFLEVNMTTGKVVSHEGRHRMVGLKKEGYKSVEIIVYAERGTLPSGFSEYNYKKIANQIDENSYKTIFEKMIPINEEYIKNLK